MAVQVQQVLLQVHLYHMQVVAVAAHGELLVLVAQAAAAVGL
jgi:hypothetical protein